MNPAPPIPYRSGHTGVTDKLRRMRKGDFLFIEGSDRNKIGCSIQYTRTRYDGQWTHRAMEYEGVLGIGIWCLEESR